MEDVNSLYLLWKYILGKNSSQGYASPSDFNLLINQGQKSYVAYLLGSFQRYTPGRPVANVELGQNSVIRQRLAPVIYGYNLPINQNTGFSPYPGDYLQTDAMWSMYGFKRIRYADQHKFASIYGSVIDPISNNPIYTLESVGFNFYPSNPMGHTQAKLHYIREAPDMKWGYTNDAQGRPTYSAAHSTQPVWDSIALFEILVRALQIAGVNLQTQQVIAYATEIKNQGQ